MNETKQRYAKSKIYLTDKQKAQIAAQAHAKVQAFTNEANQVQSRRFELASALLIAQAGREAVGIADVAHARLIASELVNADAVQKWSDLKALFAELGMNEPQPPLEWAAKQVGVTLIEALPDEPESLILTADSATLEKVIQ